jgi:hypothetical protein
MPDYDVGNESYAFKKSLAGWRVVMSSAAAVDVRKAG